MSARSPAPAARRSVALSVLLLVTTWSLVAQTARAHADDELALQVATCNGLTATEVGDDGETMVGTSGDDVFVTRGAARVDTGAGNDSICVTGRGSILVNAGSGDDFVGARRHVGKTFASLGFGDDVFLGGPGADRVWSQEASNQTATDDRDGIYTGEGDDYVISGSRTAPNHDSVNLGPGNDVLVTYGFSGLAKLVGGLGTNTYQPLPGESGEWRFDNVRGRASLNGDKRLVWVSFQRFDLKGLQGAKVVFLGSRASERVTAGGTCRVVLKGREGNDRLAVAPEGCHNLPADDALLVGGSGDDSLFGSAGNDVLRGGAGHDRGDGGPGNDTCQTEVRITC